MIVELLDYRPPRGKDPVLENPAKSRVVLSPNSETLWTTLCLLSQKQESPWTDEEALEVEARILVSDQHPILVEASNSTRCLRHLLSALILTPIWRGW